MESATMQVATVVHHLDALVTTEVDCERQCQHLLMGKVQLLGNIVEGLFCLNIEAVVSELAALRPVNNLFECQ